MRTVEDAGPYKFKLKFEQPYKSQFTNLSKPALSLPQRRIVSQATVEFALQTSSIKGEAKRSVSPDEALVI